MRLYLEDGNTVNATDYITKASMLIYSDVSKESTIEFKFCQARIWDSQRDFIKSSLKYYELSCLPEIDEVDRQNCLYIT